LKEGERREGARRIGELRLERIQQFLHALRGALLLLEAIAQAMHLVLQRREGLLELRAAAEQLGDALGTVVGALRGEPLLEEI
jgi:hypothetical protein